MCDRARVSVSAAITLPSAESDWLMRFASAMRSPVAPVTATRSDPARSTRLSLPTRKVRDGASDAGAPGGGGTSCECSTTSMKTACDREDASLARVALVARVAAPRRMRSKISAGERTTHSESPST